MESTPKSNIFVAKKEFTNNWIPDGFVLLIGPDDEKYIVPEFLVDSLDQDYYTMKEKKKLSAHTAQGTVSFEFCAMPETKTTRQPRHTMTAHLTNHFGRFLKI